MITTIIREEKYCGPESSRNECNAMNVEQRKIVQKWLDMRSWAACEAGSRAANNVNAAPCCAMLPLLPRHRIKLTSPSQIESGYTAIPIIWPTNLFLVSYSPIESETDWCGDKDE